MAWPELSRCERFVDWSWFQNKGWPLHQPFDVDAFCRDHPEVDGAVLRFCWPSGAKDEHYDHYFDGFQRNGKKVLGYGWPNPTKSVTSVMNDWMRALGSRIPPALFSDWEETGTFNGKTKAQITEHLRVMHLEARQAFPDQAHGMYSRAAWLDAHIIVADWFHEIRWWLAHWPFPPPDFNDQASTFAELDAMLPIDNGFTPFRGSAVKIRQENVVGWQASSRLAIVPNGRSDGGYFLKSYLLPLFQDDDDDTIPLPPPDVQPIPIRLEVPAGRTEVEVVEV
jgi:hypothetical protein